MQYGIILTGHRLYFSVITVLPLKVLQEKNIKNILNVTVDEPGTYEHSNSINFMRLPIHDFEDQPIHELFEQAYEFLSAAYNRQEAVLVHCAAGVSRSATIVLSFIMKKFNWSLKDTVGHVITRRKVVDPNQGFYEKLVALEVQLKGVSEASLTYEQYKKVRRTPPITW